MGIPVTDVAVNNTLKQILTELKKQTVEMQAQTSILNQIADGVKQLTEATYFTFTMRALDVQKQTAQGDSMDLEILDDGKGFAIDGVPDKAIKAGETYTWTASDPTMVASLDADPDNPDTPTHVRVIGKLPTPVKDGTGLIITFTLNRLVGGPLVQACNGDGTPNGAIDIVPNPNGEPGSFVFTEAAL